MTQSKIFETKQRIAKCDPDARLCTIYFDKIKYYQNCDDMFHYKSLDENPQKKFLTFNDEYINFDLKDINFLDFKLTEGCFDKNEYEDFLWKYLNFGMKKKVLHVSQSNQKNCEMRDTGRRRTKIFDLRDYHVFFNIISNCDINNDVHLEIFDVTTDKIESINQNVNLMKKFDLSNICVIDFYNISSNNTASYVNLKSYEKTFFNNFEIIDYNPYADRKGLI